MAKVVVRKRPKRPRDEVGYHVVVGDNLNDMGLKVSQEIGRWRSQAKSRDSDFFHYHAEWAYVGGPFQFSGLTSPELRGLDDTGIVCERRMWGQALEFRIVAWHVRRLRPRVTVARRTIKKSVKGKAAKK